MTRTELGRPLRRALIVGLAAAVAYGAWQVSRPAPDPFLEDAAEALDRRFEQYVALRRQEDWPKIWEMVDPRERESADLADFLGVYGQGVMKTHDIEKRDVDIDYEARRARVAVTTEAELRVSRLPAQFRAGLEIDDPADLKRSLEHDLTWVWRDGEWYFSLDEEVLSGRTAQGRSVSPVPASQG